MWPNYNTIGTSYSLVKRVLRETAIIEYGYYTVGVVHHKLTDTCIIVFNDGHGLSEREMNNYSSSSSSNRIVRR